MDRRSLPTDFLALPRPEQPFVLEASRARICESAPKRDPGQNSSKSLKSSAKTPEVGVPIGADRDLPETKTSSVYQGVEAYPRWGPASVLIHSQPRAPVTPACRRQPKASYQR